MTYLLEDHTDASTLVPGGMGELETYDAVERERAARAEAEATAAHLAELIAAEHVNVIDARREADRLRAELERQRERADAAERHLGQVLVNDYSNIPAPPLWERIRDSLRR